MLVICRSFATLLLFIILSLKLWRWRDADQHDDRDACVVMSLLTHDNQQLISALFVSCCLVFRRETSWLFFVKQVEEEYSNTRKPDKKFIHWNKS